MSADTSTWPPLAWPTIRAATTTWVPWKSSPSLHRLPGMKSNAHQDGSCCSRVAVRKGALDVDGAVQGSLLLEKPAPDLPGLLALCRE